MSRRPRMFDSGWDQWYNRQQKAFESDVLDDLNDLDALTLGRFDKFLDRMYPVNFDQPRKGVLKGKHGRRLRDTLADLYQKTYEDIEKQLEERMDRTYKRRRAVDLRMFRKAFPWSREKTIRASVGVTEAEKKPFAEINVLPGGHSKEFNHFLKTGFDHDKIPAVTLRHWGEKNLAFMQKKLQQMVKQGEDLGWSRRQVMAKFRTGLTDREAIKQTRSRVMRVLRTEHQHAVTAAQGQFALTNQDKVAALIRVTGGRPCPACTSLDGKSYPVGSDLNDHPNGQCSWMYKMKTPAEMGMSVPPEFEYLNKPFELGYTPALEKFMAAGDEFQRRLLGPGMYRYWKETGFDLKGLYSGRGMTVPRPLYEVKRLVKAGKIPIVGKTGMPINLETIFADAEVSTEELKLALLTISSHDRYKVAKKLTDRLLKIMAKENPQLATTYQDLWRGWKSSSGGYAGAALKDWSMRIHGTDTVFHKTFLNLNKTKLAEFNKIVMGSKEKFPLLDRVMEYQYVYTQAILKKAGHSKLTLERGVHGQYFTKNKIPVPVKGQTFDTIGNGIDSWTNSAKTADGFGTNGAVFRSEVAREHILSTNMNSFLDFTESEFVILGVPHKVTVRWVDDYLLKTSKTQGKPYIPSETAGDGSWLKGLGLSDKEIADAIGD